MGWVKALIRSGLKIVLNRERFNDSAIYRLYLRLAYPDHVQRVARTTAFYERELAAVKAKMVFDIGANCGDKTVLYAALGNIVVSVEPAAGAVQSLRNRFANTPSVTIVMKGVGSGVGYAEFYEFSETDCYNTFSTKWVDTLKQPTGGNSVAKAVNYVSRVPITTIDQLMLEFGVPDYVKIDVEGYELEVLKGLTRSLPLVSFECNLPEYLTETLECIALLRQRSNISEFNFCISEPADRFYSDVWLSSEEIGALVQNVTFRYMEIYCRTI